MGENYIDFGKPYDDIRPDNFENPSAQWCLEACLKNKLFKVIQTCWEEKAGEKNADVIIVDCYCEEVPTKNVFGIKPKERLALVFYTDLKIIPKVFALRKSFPVVSHLNQVLPGEPKDLCLYFESWDTVRRTWTPQRHLQTIIWWIVETANGTIHKSDQPVERMYFESSLEVVLPPDFIDKKDDSSLILKLVVRNPGNGKVKVATGVFVPKSDNKIDSSDIVSLIVTTPPIVHGEIETFPGSLGQLEEQMSSRGVSFIDELRENIKHYASEGLVRNPTAKTLIIIQIPICRAFGETPEMRQQSGFLLERDITFLGEAIGAIFKENDTFFPFQLLGKNKPSLNNVWKELTLLPIQINSAVSKDFARKASGIQPSVRSPMGILAGVGALGGSLAEIWSKQGWGDWTLVDDDILKAHNVIRHPCKECHIGLEKVTAVKNLMELNYYPGSESVVIIPGKINSLEEKRTKDILATADLLIDVTTKLEVARDLSESSDIPRSVSAFLTPNGLSSVLLFEDNKKEFKLVNLEAQYYRAILNYEWGENHLLLNQSGLRVGASCRDISGIMSYEDVLLHASILAKQIRVLYNQPNPKIKIWESEPESCVVKSYDVEVNPVKEKSIMDWQISWDLGVERKAKEIRNASLPNETGGIVVGYIDQVLKTIFVVDILPAPTDSVGDRTGFVRGTKDLRENLLDINNRTASVVDYIGEWHSHPPFSSSKPSNLDLILLEDLSKKMSLDGLPALMLIVGSAGNISFTIKKNTS